MKFRGKRLAVVVLDMLACVLALGLAVWLRFDGKIPEMYTPDLFFTYCGIAMVSVVAAGFILGAYNSLWEYVGFSEMFRQFFIVMLSGFVFLVVKLLGLVEVYGSIAVSYTHLDVYQRQARQLINWPITVLRAVQPIPFACVPGAWWWRLLQSPRVW